MDQLRTDAHKRKLFLWGIAFAWSSSLPFIVWTFRFFRGISEQKATGLGAVAGGLAEGYLTFGAVTTLALQVGAIVLLVRSLSKGNRMRVLLSLLSICWSGFMILVFGVFVWLVYVELPYRTPGPR